MARLSGAKTADPKQLSTRDIVLLGYENGVRANYLLLAILGAIIGRPFIGTPPEIVASWMFAVAADLFALAILLRTRNGIRLTLARIGIIVLLVLQLIGLVASVLDVETTVAGAVVRTAIAVLLFYWGFRQPIVSFETPSAERE